jgi:hypothetical protein
MTSEKKRRSNLKNLEKAIANRPGRTPNLKHGAYCSHTRKRYTDLRTREGKALNAVLRGLRDDLGDISAGQQLMLDRIKEKLVVLQQIGQYVDRQPSVVTEAGELLPCLGRGYSTYAEGLRRDIEALYTLAGKQAKRGPSLQEYLAQNAASEASEGPKKGKQ